MMANKKKKIAEQYHIPFSGSTESVMDHLQFEKRIRVQGYPLVAGVDEAGRGPLAGPVVAAAVILPADFNSTRIRDSKKLTHTQREKLYPDIMEQALAVGIGQADHEEIDRLNILQATFLAMIRAIDQLNPQPDFILVDGNRLPRLKIPAQAIVKGDSRSLSIAAASIIAKVTRDRLMLTYDAQYPEFGFAQHKGYPTHAHQLAIKKNGFSPIHRRSFTVKLYNLAKPEPKRKNNNEKEP